MKKAFENTSRDHRRGSFRDAGAAVNAGNSLAVRILFLGFLVCFVHSVAAADPAVTLTNTTRGGSDFIAGDDFELDITGGLSNASVTVDLVKNGVDQGTYSEGSTNGSGFYQLTGYEPGSNAGAWTETWYVGGVQATPVLSFSVIAASGSIGASPNPCTIYYGQSFCTPSVSWSSLGTSAVQVWVSVNGGAESNFASSGSGGSYFQDASWIEVSNTYVFVLYDYSGGGRGSQLGSTTVTATTSSACPP